MHTFCGHISHVFSTHTKKTKRRQISITQFKLMLNTMYFESLSAMFWLPLFPALFLSSPLALGVFWFFLFAIFRFIIVNLQFESQEPGLVFHSRPSALSSFALILIMCMCIVYYVMCRFYLYDTNSRAKIKQLIVVEYTKWKWRTVQRKICWRKIKAQTFYLG